MSTTHKRTLVWLGLAIFLAAGALLLPGVGGRLLPAGALGAISTLTPTPEPSPTAIPTADPTATAAAALFSIEQAAMISRYPDGVEFVFSGSSSAGSIARVQVITWTRDGGRTSMNLEWDAARGAFVHFDRRFSPPWVEINYRFRASDSAGNRYESADLRAEYADNTRKWLRAEDENVVVLMFGARQSLMDDLFTSAAQAMFVLEDAFGFQLDYKPYVVVMPDQASFEEWQEYPDPYLAGQTFSAQGYTIQTLQWGEGDLINATIPHELTHIFQGFIAEAWDVPAWFTEGNASYFEPVPQYDYEQRVRNVAGHPDFPTLQSNISTEYPGPDGRNRWVYDIGYAFMQYWIQTYGWDSHRAFWQAQTTQDFETAMALATGVSFADLENAWRTYIGAPGAAPTLIPLPTLMPFPTAPGMSGSGG